MSKAKKYFIVDNNIWILVYLKSNFYSKNILDYFKNILWSAIILYYKYKF